ncbi:hypothetical protein [Lacipirellula limnantheis]|jgi:hypothetical protein|nr:hypothetical protein [Lacipirellula limnantheis]
MTPTDPRRRTAGRFRRQFSIRSALIAFAVVAALLAMPLTL